MKTRGYSITQSDSKDVPPSRCGLDAWYRRIQAVCPSLGPYPDPAKLGLLLLAEVDPSHPVFDTIEFVSTDC